MVAASVVTMGAPGVMKVSTSPSVVPAELVATTQYQYCVPPVRPVTEVDQFTAAVPEPCETAPVVGRSAPKVVLQVPATVEKRNCAVVARPLGLMVALSVAELVTTEVAATVVTVGAEGVVNVCTGPKVVPTALVAPAQK